MRRRLSAETLGRNPCIARAVPPIEKVTRRMITHAHGGPREILLSLPRLRFLERPEKRS